LKAAILKAPGEKISIEDIQKPSLQGKDVLLRTEFAGVCTTDLKIITGAKNVSYLTFPVTLGHEFVGEVVDIGPKHTRFNKGDYIVPFPAIFCGECEQCLSGEHRLCQGHIEALGYNYPGGFAEYVRLPGHMFDSNRSRVVRIDEGISHKLASVLEPISCCFHGIEQSQVKMGDTVLILGLGFMGLVMAQVARLYGASRVIGSDPLVSRRKLASDVGADVVLSPFEDDYREQVLAATDGKGADVVIAALALPSVFEDGLRFVKAGGTLNLFGGSAAGSVMSVDPNIIHYKEVAIVGTAGYRYQDVSGILNILEDGQLQIEQLITNIYPLDEINVALEANLENSEVKTLIKFA